MRRTTSTLTTTTTTTTRQRCRRSRSATKGARRRTLSSPPSCRDLNPTFVNNPGESDANPESVLDPNFTRCLPTNRLSVTRLFAVERAFSNVMTFGPSSSMMADGTAWFSRERAISPHGEPQSALADSILYSLSSRRCWTRVRLKGGSVDDTSTDHHPRPPRENTHGSGDSTSVLARVISLLNTRITPAHLFRCI